MPALCATGRVALRGSSVGVASVSTAFRSGLASMEVKLEDVRLAVAAGADEVDRVIDRGAFLAGRYGQVADEIAAVKAVCGSVVLKVILETGELMTYDNVRRATMLAMEAGADFITTSTGKMEPASTLPVRLLLMQAARDFAYQSGRPVGITVGGGVRTAKMALQYLVLVKETLGDQWLSPERFRIGASSLLNDVLMQLTKERTGRYQSGDYFTKD